MRFLRRLWLGLVYLCWNRSARRLRSALRLLLAAVVLYLVNLLFNTLWRWLGIPGGAYGQWHYVRTLIVVIIGLTLSMVLLDRQRPAWFGHNGLPDIGMGFMIGGLAMTCLFLLALAAGWVRIQTALWQQPLSLITVYHLLMPFAVFVCVGFYEELLVRGYLLPTLAHGLSFHKLGTHWPLTLAWLLTSILFGLAHAWNPNASLLSTLFIIGAGLMLGLAALLSGKLGLAVGLHIAWNWFQRAVFGFAVSGTRIFPESIFAIRLTGPVLWTGGAFGPEAGLFGAFAILVAAGTITAWSRWRYGRLSWRLDMAIGLHKNTTN